MILALITSWLGFPFLLSYIKRHQCRAIFGFFLKLSCFLRLSSYFANSCCLFSPRWFLCSLAPPYVLPYLKNTRFRIHSFWKCILHNKWTFQSKSFFSCFSLHNVTSAFSCNKTNIATCASWDKVPWYIFKWCNWKPENKDEQFRNHMDDCKNKHVTFKK